MIELPKYSVPTYDPRGLAVNERTDFTRRIPALEAMPFPLSSHTVELHLPPHTIRRGHP